MSGDRLRDELVATLRQALPLGVHWSDRTHEHAADAVLPVVQARIDAAREQDLAAIENQVAEHVATRVTNLKELVDTLVALDDKHTAERDAAVARAETAEQALQRVRELIDPPSEMAQILHGERVFSEIDIRRALDEPAEPEALDD